MRGAPMRDTLTKFLRDGWGPSLPYLGSLQLSWWEWKWGPPPISHKLGESVSHRSTSLYIYGVSSHKFKLRIRYAQVNGGAHLETHIGMGMEGFQGVPAILLSVKNQLQPWFVSSLYELKSLMVNSPFGSTHSRSNGLVNSDLTKSWWTCAI